MVQFLGEASIESEDQKTHWNIEECLLQRGSIFMLEIKILFMKSFLIESLLIMKLSVFKKMRSKKGICKNPSCYLRKRESSHKQYQLQNKTLVGDSMNMSWEPIR